MVAQRFWVVGGEYADTSFRSLTGDTPMVAGPFDSEAEAKTVWRGLYERRPCSALTRFSIVQENLRVAS